MRVPALSAALLSAALLVAACEGGKDKPESSTTTTEKSTASSVETTATSMSVPEPATAGEDFDRIFREISKFEEYVYEHPDPALLPVIYDESANVLSNVRGQIENLRNRGYRYDDEGQVVHKVEVEKRSDASHVLLRVVTSHGEQRVVDAQGNVVQRGPGWEPRREQFLLEQGIDGKWRIQYYTNLGPAS